MLEQIGRYRATIAQHTARLAGEYAHDPAFLELLDAPCVPQVGHPPYHRLADFTASQRREFEHFIRLGDFAPLRHNGEAWISFENICSYISADLEPEHFDPPFVWLLPISQPEHADR